MSTNPTNHPLIRRISSLAALAAVAACTDPMTTVVPVSSAGIAAHGGATAYPSTDLGDFGEAAAINAQGQIVGSLGGAPTLWKDGERIILPVLGGSPGVAAAKAINAAGQIVGWSSHADGARHAVLWDGGAVSSLGTLGGPSSLARAINSRSQIAGESLGADLERRAFLWEDGVMHDLGALPGGAFSSAHGINERGQVVGWSDRAGGPYRATLWHNGDITDLGTLPGGEMSPSTAYAINARGQVVGSSGKGAETHAFLWERGLMTDLGTLGGTYSAALAISPDGRVVGESTTADGELHAFLWADGMMTDLDGLYEGRSSATGINAAGQIVGSSGILSHAIQWRIAHGVRVFTDRATFLAALSSSQTFNAAPYCGPIPPYCTHTFMISEVGVLTVTGGAVWVKPSIPGTPFRFGFQPDFPVGDATFATLRSATPLHAFGVDFGEPRYPPYTSPYNPTSTFTFKFDNGLAFARTTLAAPPGPFSPPLTFRFFGVISPTPFFEFTIMATNPESLGVLNGVAYTDITIAGPGLGKGKR
jgi:probable HAF family extracellular repeat protein